MRADIVEVESGRTSTPLPDTYRNDPAMSAAPLN